MRTPMIPKQQVLAALTIATHTRHDQGREALAGPIVLHLFMQASAESRGDGPPVGGAPLEEAVDQLVGISRGPWPATSRPRPSRRRPRRHDQGASEND